MILLLKRTNYLWPLVCGKILLQELLLGLFNLLHYNWRRKANLHYWCEKEFIWVFIHNIGSDADRFDLNIWSMNFFFLPATRFLSTSESEIWYIYLRFLILGWVLKWLRLVDWWSCCSYGHCSLLLNLFITNPAEHQTSKLCTNCYQLT